MGSQVFEVGLMRWVVGIVLRGNWNPDDNVYPYPEDICIDFAWLECLALDWDSCGWEQRKR